MAKNRHAIPRELFERSTFGLVLKISHENRNNNNRFGRTCVNVFFSPDLKKTIGLFLISLLNCHVAQYNNRLMLTSLCPLKERKEHAKTSNNIQSANTCVLRVSTNSLLRSALSTLKVYKYTQLKYLFLISFYFGVYFSIFKYFHTYLIRTDFFFFFLEMNKY